MSHSDFDSLGLKVQRAQRALEQARGVGEVDGIRVVVDANNRLVEVSAPDADALIAAYRAALLDLGPRLDEAMAEVRADSRFSAISTFVEANTAREEAEYDTDDRSTSAGLESAW
ncbi:MULTISPECIES: YbaB/EbfC family nucleoid-associated protein [unclassified Nocardia]|uniref:YbaB/EbfC family nucleoid-associated protein n=1 Tax=unclassified Nocardia TaxID=2637762 RepID=UPI001CE4B077|nr:MULTISPECIES: YbaB/EbfC family nucleoid-associated protein [unclassified Nocardia]